MMKLVVEARFLWAVMLAAPAAVPAARGVWLNMPSSGLQCVFKELQSNVVVMGDYYSFYGDADVNYTVKPPFPSRFRLHLGVTCIKKKELGTGNSPSRRTSRGTTWHALRWRTMTVSAGLEWKIGIATKDWDSVAKMENIEGLDLELEKLQSYVKAISEKMLDLMKRELKMKVLSTETNARVASYSQASLGVCILVSALQLWYLRRYFIKRKLI